MTSEDKPTDLGSADFFNAAHQLQNRALEVRRRCTVIGGQSRGKTVAHSCEKLIATAQSDEQTATKLNTAGEAVKIREQAAARWNRNAPRDSELEAASKAIGAAGEELKRAANAGANTAAAQHAWTAAVANSRDLNERRTQADKDYDAAEKRAGAKLAEVDGKAGLEQLYGAGGAGMDLPGKHAGNTAPAKPTPGLTKGASTAAKPAAAAPVPSTSASSAANTAAPTQDKSVSDLLSRLHPTPQQQQAPGQPQIAPAAGAAAPAATAPARPDGRKADDVLKSSDFPDMPVPFALPSSPLPSAATTTSAAQTSPTVAGTSAADMKTESNVSGRPEGARGAFSPATTASGATGAATAAGTGLNAKGMQAAQTGMGQPGMVPPMAAGGSGMGARKESPKIHTATQREWEEGVVPGGTIAQNRLDYDEDGKKKGSKS